MATCKPFNELVAAGTKCKPHQRALLTLAFASAVFLSILFAAWSCALLAAALILSQVEPADLWAASLWDSSFSSEVGWLVCAPSECETNASQERCQTVN